jgi:hypothetical protein
MVYINDDCFDLIKQFAGIYSISTNWDKANHLSTEILLKYYNKHILEKTTQKNAKLTLTYQKQHYTKYYLKKINIEIKITAIFVKKQIFTGMMRHGMNEKHWKSLNELIVNKQATRKNCSKRKFCNIENI